MERVAVMLECAEIVNVFSLLKCFKWWKLLLGQVFQEDYVFKEGLAFEERLVGGLGRGMGGLEKWGYEVTNAETL